MDIQVLDRNGAPIGAPLTDDCQPAAALLPWAVAPEERERYDRWLKCQLDWLNALERKSGARNTRRAYEHDVLAFFAAYAPIQLMPWQVTPTHAATWVQDLATCGLADSTINRMVAALSSLYRYAAIECVYVTADGRREALWPWPNPFGSRTLRRDVSPYARASYPSSTQVSGLLAAIDLTTVTGLRNMALLSGIFATTRRVAEWLNLRGRDIHEDAAGGHWFEYRYKGGKIKRQVMPADIWRIIVAYLQADGRPWPIPADEYVFQSTSSVARRLRPGATYDPAGQPISDSYVNALIRRYGAQAGVPESKLHAHALRHAGARWRKDQGADVWQLKDTLGHASIAITQVYTDTVLDEPEDPFADAIGAVLPKQLKLLFR